MSTQEILNRVLKIERKIKCLYCYDPLDINTQTGTSYTLVSGDEGTLIEMDNALANTLTVPPNSSVAFPIGTEILIVQKGAGQTTIAEGTGVTINSDSGLLAIGAQYTGATLVKRADNEWYLFGNLA